MWPRSKFWTASRKKPLKKNLALKIFLTFEKKSEETESLENENFGC